jgi:hypothetical protein
MHYFERELGRKQTLLTSFKQLHQEKSTDFLLKSADFCQESADFAEKTSDS